MIKEQIIDKILVDKYTNKQLLRWLFDEFGYKQSYSYRLIRRAKLDIKKEYLNAINKLINKHINKLLNDYDELIKDKKYQLAIELIKEINNLKK